MERIIVPIIGFLGKHVEWGFPGGPAVKNVPASAGDVGFLPGMERSHMCHVGS